MSSPCPECNDKGTVGDSICTRCNGYGGSKQNACFDVPTCTSTSQLRTMASLDEYTGGINALIMWTWEDLPS
ncbi:hypothetical protein K469DRAFT_711771 [Zopfia rhizophila CBS 207.26]|uniref:Uncharacterized protein n=1 Tax=Zopfia rhizophila CBS 207.26 TaxID=1314779 RepID=A0A6A6DV01_9PEZI|nr:hypothetical protein K469DRAFT_711771 [Zopfia rhizophila CBS 207.26]